MPRVGGCAISGSDDSIIDVGRNIRLMRGVIEERSDGHSELSVLEGAGHALLGRMLPPMLASGYADTMAEWILGATETPGQRGGHEMNDAKRLAREWIEAWDRGDPTALPLADDFVHESPFGRIEGREKYLEVVQPLAEANVVSLHVRDVIGEGDRASVAFTMETPSGPVACCDWVSVADGRITSVRSYYDSRELPNFEKY